VACRGVDATINLGDEGLGFRVDGEMNMKDGLPSNDKNGKVSICLFGWWVGLQCDDI